MGNRKMMYKGVKLPDADTYYFEVVLMIKNKEEFTAEIEDEELATEIYNYILAHSQEMSIDFSEEKGIEIRDFIFFYDYDDPREYVVSVIANKITEFPNTDDIAEMIAKAKVRVTKIKIRAFTRTRSF